MRHIGIPLFLLACASLCFAVPEAWEAASHNIGISGALLGSNRCGFEAKAPSERDLFSYAGIRAVSLVPQIDNITSDLQHPQLVWGWAADAPSNAVFLLSGSTACPGGEIEYYNRSAVSFSDGRLEYRFAGREKEIPLEGTGPNPIPLELDSGNMPGEFFRELFVPLNVRLSANAKVSYSFRKRQLYEKCDHFGNFSVCYCAEKTTRGKAQFAAALSDERNFSVEVGPVQELWLNPPLQSRLSGNASGKVLFFARRMPAKIIAASGGNEIASATPFEFALANGSCGEKLVRSSYNPRASNAALNKSGDTLFPSQLVDKNASFLPFYFEFSWQEVPGKREMRLEYEDWFSNRQVFARDFSVRLPMPFHASQKNNSSASRQGGEDRPPAYLPGLQKISKPPDLSPLFLLAAIPFAIGAIGLLRWMRKIVP